MPRYLEAFRRRFQLESFDVGRLSGRNCSKLAGKILYESNPETRCRSQRLQTVRCPRPLSAAFSLPATSQMVAQFHRIQPKRWVADWRTAAQSQEEPLRRRVRPHRSRGRLASVQNAPGLYGYSGAVTRSEVRLPQPGWYGKAGVRELNYVD